MTISANRIDLSLALEDVWREADGALLLKPPDGGRGKARLSSDSEAVLTRVIEETYLTQQRVRADPSTNSAE